MTRHQIGKGATGFLILVALLVAPALTFADDAETTEDAKTAGASLGTDPGQAKYAGSDSTEGAPPLTIRTSTQSWDMGFHGYLRAPMRFSFDNHPVERYDLDADGNPQRDPNTGLYLMDDTGERDWRLNMPASAPDVGYLDWRYTNNLGGPWAEMVFSYGNSIAVGNVSVASWNITDGGWRQIMSQLGIDQAWVTLNFPRAFGGRGGLKWNVGVFGNRYGSAGRYDAGRYDTYIMGRTHVAGETLTANIDLADKLTLFLEHGFGAKTDVLRGNPKGDLEPSPAPGDNSYAWVPYSGGEGQHPNMVHHAHGGLFIHTHKLWKELWINGHFIHSFTNSADASDNDSQFTERQKDGKMIVGGAEVKFNGAMFGDVYLGFSHVKTDGLPSMADGLELLHSQGGWSFAKNFYGDQTLGITADGDNSRAGEPNPGTGKVNTLEWQYMLSIARLLWNLQEKDFWGQGPDLQLSFWGMMNFVSVDEDLEPFLKRYAKKKLKLGAEAMYTPLKYFGIGVRFDHVKPDLEYDPDDDTANDSTLMSFAPFSSLTPKIRIKTAFVTHEEVNISYTRYFWNGDRDEVRAADIFEGAPADRNAFMLSVNMWW